MAKKTEVYLDLSAQLERTLADIARRKATLLEDIARRQADLNQRQADVNEQLSKLDGLTKEATDKLNDLRNGPDEGSEMESKSSEASSAISRLRSAA